MALESCVLAVLRVLTVAALSGLLDALNMYRAMLEFEIAKLQMQALKYDGLAARVDLVAAFYNEALTQAEDQLASFPLSEQILAAVAECTQIGDMMVAPQTVLESLRAKANSVTYKAREIVSFSEELQAAINKEQQLSALLAEIMDAIVYLKVEKFSPPAP